MNLIYAGFFACTGDLAVLILGLLFLWWSGAVVILRLDLVALGILLSIETIEWRRFLISYARAYFTLSERKRTLVSPKRTRET